MNDITKLSVREIAAKVAGHELSAEAVVRQCLERIEAAEPQVRAWQHLDAPLALARARAIDAGTVHGALLGVPLGAKDLMDTADMPTTYGSPIYAGWRPKVDAACVAACREAGAVILGKTVSTEFATFQPGPTRNPRAPADRPHTPGGSSSGSAAAVAAGMVPLAFGTQTAGSIVRPAAYCGVVGYKPTHGLLPLAGIKALSPSLDTAGMLARSVDDAAFAVGILARLDLQAALPNGYRVGLCHTPNWDRASTDARRAFGEAGRLFGQAGATVVDVQEPGSWAGLTQAQIDIMGYEALAAFAPERRTHAGQFSAAFSAFLASALAVDGSRYAEAQRLAERARAELATLFRTADVLVAPSSEGEAPPGLEATGNPVFNRMWTLLGVPCVHVPLGVGTSGLPVGVTVIAPRWSDALALAAAGQLERGARAAGMGG
jgi:amidase